MRLYLPSEPNRSGDIMLGQGLVVLSLEQLLAPFREHQLQEEPASLLLWQSSMQPEEILFQAKKEAGNAMEQDDNEVHLKLKLSLSLPVGPTLAAACRFLGR